MFSLPWLIIAALAAIVLGVILALRTKQPWPIWLGLAALFGAVVYIFGVLVFVLPAANYEPQTFVSCTGADGRPHIAYSTSDCTSSSSLKPQIPPKVCKDLKLQPNGGLCVEDAQATADAAFDKKNDSVLAPQATVKPTQPAQQVNPTATSAPAQPNTAPMAVAPVTADLVKSWCKANCNKVTYKEIAEGDQVAVQVSCPSCKWTLKEKVLADFKLPDHYSVDTWNGKETDMGVSGPKDDVEFGQATFRQTP